MNTDAQPIADELRERLLGPVLEAVTTALREVAMTEATEGTSYRTAPHQLRGELIAYLELSSSAQRCLALGFSRDTAASLARRVLAETMSNPDAPLIDDCLGELANVSAGQAKALLHGTPWQFTFGTPRVTTDTELPIKDVNECLVARLDSDVGEIVVQLLMTKSQPR